jgi:hypothetical protein
MPAVFTHTKAGRAIYAPCDTAGQRNFSMDPLFCNEAGGDFQIGRSSPCAPGSATGCGLVGAYPVACVPTQVNHTTWGRLKVLYR